MIPVKIVLLLRLSVKDQPFANKDMNLKNVIPDEKSLCFDLSGHEFMQKHKSSFCLNSRLVMKTRAIFLYMFSVLWVKFFLTNIGCFNLLKNKIKNKYKIKAHSDDLPWKSKMNYL